MPAGFVHLCCECDHRSLLHIEVSKLSCQAPRRVELSYFSNRGDVHVSLNPDQSYLDKVTGRIGCWYQYRFPK